MVIDNAEVDSDHQGGNAAARLLPRWLQGLRSPPEPLAGAVRVAKAKILLTALPVIVGFNCGLAALTAIALADYHRPAILAAWLASIAVTAVPGLRHWLRFRAAPPPRSVSRRFIRNTALYSLVVALPWVVLLTVLYPFDSETHEIAVIFVIAGITAGASAMVAALPEVTVAYVAPMLIGVVQALLRESEFVDLVMAAMTAAYLFFLLFVVVARYERFVAAVALGEDRERLLRQLAKSQERLARAFTATDETVLLFDGDDRLLLTNFGARSPLAAFSGAPEPGTTFAAWLATVVRTGAFTAANGKEAEFLASALANWRLALPETDLRLANGEYLRIVIRTLGDGEKIMILGDATEARANAKLAREHESRLADFAAASGEWWWEQDADLRFTRLSDRVTDYLGENPDRFVGKRRDDIVDPTFDPAAWRNHLADLAARRRFRDFRYRLRAEFGGVHYVSISGKPIFATSGEFRGYRGVARDITADVEAAEILRRAKEQAVFASQAKSHFLAHMSHELRTPLNAVIGYSEMMARQTFGPLANDKYEEYVGHIRDSGEHLLGLIGEILEMSTIDAGGRKLVEETVDLRRLARSVSHMVEGRANAAGLTLNAELALPLPSVRGDVRALKQILLNMLGNAIKFTPPGGRVTLAAAAGRQGVELSVSDSGIGMSAESIAVAWTPFARGNSEHANKYPGAGLGLPLVKALTELHGGTVDIQSAVGAGTTITVRLPATRVVGAGARQAVY